MFVVWVLLAGRLPWQSSIVGGTGGTTGPVAAGGGVPPVPAFVPPATTADVAALRAASFTIALQCQGKPLELAAQRIRLRELAEKAAADVRYEQDAAEAVAILYRVYAASLLLDSSGEPMASEVGQAVTWLTRSLQVYPARSTAELEAVRGYFADIACGRVVEYDRDEFVDNALTILAVVDSDSPAIQTD